MTPIHPLQARAQYLDWMRRTHPGLYGAVMNYALRNQPITLGDVSSDLANGQSVVSSQSLWEKIVDGASKLGTAYLTYKQQKDVNQVNLERAQAGLPPIEAQDYQPGINVGLAASTRDQITQWILIGGIALVVVMALRR